MKDKKKIACVVLNYNDAETTIEYVEFAKELNIYDYIIVVDNCSTDDSYEKLIKVCWGSVKLYKTSRNGGYGYGNNVGVRIASELGCEFVAISNPDVRYERSMVQNLIEFMCEGNAAVVAPCQYNGYTKKKIKNIAWDVPTFSSYVFGSLYMLKGLFSVSMHEEKGGLVKVDCVPGAYLIVSTKAFIQINGYDERVFLYCEESILGYKLRENRFNTYLAIKEKYYHFESVSIKKTIDSIYIRQKMIYNNRMFYLREYLHMGNAMLLIAKVVFKIAMLETRLKNLIKKRL